ncbi:16S rRNA (guanine(966)-N(2))-methyltransferase RsmD [Pelagibacteraceae bacterium]|nr:16S rRNA (guanine(966)-N(2))-methyltransferase RsmD [Pelagibacteraceae bacterium]
MPNIIGGKFKRTKIEVPNKFVRPTSAIKREAIFSILESFSLKNSIDIYKNKSIIDVYAGTGLVGLEAISRGMKKSYFIENNESVFKKLQNNCDKICKNDEYEIIFEKAISGIHRVFEIEPSVIFIDPPYYKEDINLLLLIILRNNIKSNDTVIIIETEKKEQLVIPDGLDLLKEKIYGKTKLLFLN